MGGWKDGLTDRQTDGQIDINVTVLSGRVPRVPNVVRRLSVDKGQVYFGLRDVGYSLYLLVHHS